MSKESICNHDEDLSCEETIDPRIKEELERLNFASEEINKLERELDMARNTFRHIHSDSTSALNALKNKLGKCVGKTRPYFDLVKTAKQAQSDAQHAALCYQRAISEHRSAKTMVIRAEETLIKQNSTYRQFDLAWQEMLNQATIKLLESEKESNHSEATHLIKAAQYCELQKKIKKYESDLTKNIQKAKPFFELKEKRELQLTHEKITVDDLVRALGSAKQQYRESLIQLEKISEQIHEQRNGTLNLMPFRTPGVGAEDEQEELPPIKFEVESISSTCSLKSSGSE